MAGNNQIVLNAQFNPFSYQELLAPVQAADTEQKAEQEDQGKLETLSSVWKNKLNAENDPIAYKQYTDYMNQLQQQSNALATNGLTPGSRQSLIDLKSGYSSNISPIEEAYLARQNGVKYQNELRGRDNSVEFENDFKNASVDDFLKNPNLTSTYVSGAAVKANVAGMATQFADQLTKDPTMSKADHGYLMSAIQHGMSADTINQIINNPEVSPNLKGKALDLKNIIDGAVNTTGINSWGTPQAIQNIRNYANQGAWAAMGKTDIKFDEDWEKKLYMEEAAKAKAAQNPPTDNSGSLPFTQSYYMLNKPIANQINGLRSKLFDANGVPLSTAFAHDGSTNPMQLYEQSLLNRANNEHSPHQVEYNGKLDNIIAKYKSKYPNLKRDSNGTLYLDKPVGMGYTPDLKTHSGNWEISLGNSYKIPSEVKDDYNKARQVYINQSQKDQENIKPSHRNFNAPISTEDYNNMKSYGITSKDDYRTIQAKIGYAEQHAQTSQTGYGMGLTDYTPIDNDIAYSVARSNKSLTPISSGEDGYKLKTDKTVSATDLNNHYIDKTKSLFTNIEYVPYFHGLVGTTQDGTKYKINSYGKDDSFNQTVTEGDKHVQTALSQGRLDVAKDYSFKLRNGLLQILSHGRNQMEGNTDKNPFSPITK